MKTVRIDNKDYEVGSEAHLDALERQTAETLKAEKDRADALTAKLDAAEKREADLKGRPLRAGK